MPAWIGCASQRPTRNRFVLQALQKSHLIAVDRRLSSMGWTMRDTLGITPLRLGQQGVRG
jgi:hypothetical protein